MPLQTHEPSTARAHVLARIALGMITIALLSSPSHGERQTTTVRTIQPTCLEVFKTACPATAAFYGTVKGSCCLYPPPGYTSRCLPNVLKTACSRPGDTFIGTVKGDCCSNVPSSVAAPPPATATCFPEIFKSSCPVSSGAVYYGTTKGTCCINAAIGYDTTCTATFSSACKRPGDMFVGTAKGQCCTRTPKVSSTVSVHRDVVLAKPTCFEAFKTGCPAPATFFGTVKGSCCVDEAAGHALRCLPNLFKSACNRPGEMFIGSTKGSCCSRLALPGVTGPPMLYSPRCFNVTKAACSDPGATFYVTAAPEPRRRVPFLYPVNSLGRNRPSTPPHALHVCRARSRGLAASTPPCRRCNTP